MDLIMFCKKCGAELAPDAAFCEKCGTPVAAPAPADVPPAPPVSEPVQAPAADPAAVNPAASAADAGTSANPAAPAGDPWAPASTTAPTGAPVNPPDPAAPNGFAQAIPMTPAPAKKSKRGLIIGIVIAVVVILIIILAVVGLSGGGGGAEPVIGEWEMFAIIDNENTDNITPVPSGSGSIEFESNGDLTLIIDGDPYTGTWEHDSDLTERLDDARGYTIDFDDLPNGSVSLTEVSGEDTVLLLIPGISYGMSFQK